MLDGLGYVMVQVAVVALVCSLFAWLLGWAMGRGRRRTLAAAQKSGAAPASSTPAGAPVKTRTPAAATTPEAAAPPAPPVIDSSASARGHAPEALASTAPPVVPITVESGSQPAEDRVTIQSDADPDNDDARPQDSGPEELSGDADGAVVADSLPEEEPSDAASGDAPVPASAAERDARLGELRAELERTVRALDRLEAGATAAWDTTVPTLEQRIDDLSSTNATLEAELRTARGMLEAAGAETAKLRTALADRDQRGDS